MIRVIVLGAGKIGTTLAEMLAESGSYRVTLADREAKEVSPQGIQGQGVQRTNVDVLDPFSLRSALSGHQVVVAALPFFLGTQVAEAARVERLHYFDLTEDVATARAIRKIAEEGGQTAFIPQCGLAPGVIAIAGRAVAETFDEVLDIRLRVGALPQFPDNALKYNLTWSTDGLLNEYCNPCEALVDGRSLELPPLESLEEFSLDGVSYEAFSTSGGVGTLCESLQGRVRNLSYKTIRYPGHRDRIRMLSRDLKLCERRDLFRDVIDHAIPVTRQDVVLIFITVVGYRKGQLTQESWARKIYGDGICAAIRKTTAAGVCAMIDLHAEGLLPAKGFVRQEQARLADVLENRFGRIFA